MEFLLQKEDGELDIDVRILRDELNKQKYNHSYEFSNLKSISAVIDECMSKDKIIPVGTLEFVKSYLNIVHNVKNMNPIEVPDILREDRFLKRRYSIVDKSKLPKDGYYFTKYVSRLKVFSYTGLIEMLQNEPGDFLKAGLYQVSEVVPIISEYRVLVFRDQIIAINFYDGDCKVFPDINELQSMVGNYMRDKERPDAYSMDVAVVRNRGTALLEIHPWCSIGLYGYLFGSNLPYCYREGLEYYITKNKQLNEFSNF